MPVGGGFASCRDRSRAGFAGGRYLPGWPLLRAFLSDRAGRVSHVGRLVVGAIYDGGAPAAQNALDSSNVVAVLLEAVRDIHGRFVLTTVVRCLLDQVREVAPMDLQQAQLMVDIFLAGHNYAVSYTTLGRALRLYHETERCAARSSHFSAEEIRLFCAR